MIYSEYVLQKLIEFIMQISDVHSETLQHFLSSFLSTLRCAFLYLHNKTPIMQISEEWLGVKANISTLSSPTT